MEVDWIPTEHAVYAAVYAVHCRDLHVYATHTCDGCMFHGEPHMLTEWGFGGAGAPLIRSIAEGERGEDPRADERRWSYWIGKVCEEAHDGE